MRAQVTDTFAARVSQAAERFPTIPQDVLLPALLAGAPDEMLAQIEGQQVQVDAEGGGGIMGRVGDVITAPFEFTYEQALKPAVRTVFTIADTLFEEAIQRPSRILGGFGFGDMSFQEAKARSGNSAGLIAIRNLVDGDPATRFDLGKGFFPGGEIGEEAEAQRTQIQVEGAPFTGIGSVVAHDVRRIARILPGNYDVVAPGTTGHNILAGVADVGAAILLDPAAAGLGAVGRAGQAAKLIENADTSRAALIARELGRGPVTSALRRTAGLIDESPRPTFIREAAERALDGPMRDTVRWLADTPDFDAIYTASKGRIPRDVLLQLTDATDETAVRDILSRAMLADDATAITRTDAFRLPGRFRVRPGPPRLVTDMPGRHLDVANLDDGLKTLRDFMVGARLDPDTISARLRALAEVEDGDIDGAWNVVRHVLDDIGDNLDDLGADSTLVRAATRAFGDYREQMRAYYVDAHGATAKHPLSRVDVLVDGTEQPLESAHLVTELLNQTIPLPDARELRRLTTRSDLLRDVYTSAGWDVTTTALTSFMSAVWKPLQLLRPAWPVRVIGEEQVRMAASGLDSAFNHPVRWIAWAMGRRGGEGLKGGFEEADEFLTAMSNRASGFLDVPAGRGRSVEAWVPVRQGQQGFVEAWQRELSQLWNDPVSQRVAADGVEQARRWFWEGDGAAVRERLANAVGNRRGLVLTDDAAAQAKGYTSARAAADDYIDSVAQRLHVKTSGHPDLLDAVATGTLDDIALRGFKPDSQRAIRKAIEARIDAAPPLVKGEIAMLEQGRFSATWDRTVDAMFDMLMTRRTNELSRSRTFAQLYWGAVDELVPFMDAATGRAVADRARKTLTGPLKRRADDLAARVKAAAGDGRIGSIDDVDEFAKARALDETKRLLYDVSRRSQFADATRLIFPFGEAWKEVTTTWLRLARESPAVLRRGQQIVTEGRETGVVYRNENGEETFSYPGGGLLGKWMLGPGASVLLEGRLEGLNLVTSGVGPGFGPLVQWPLGAFLPRDPDWDWVRDIALPFGSDIESVEDLTPGSLANAVLPSALRRVLEGVTGGGLDPRLYNNVVADTARAMVASGQASIDTPEQMKATLEAAASRARLGYVIRGVLQSALPTSPAMKLEVEDTDGRWHSLTVLAQEWRRIRETSVDDAEATQAFSGKFGFDPWFVGQAKTRSLAERPVSEGGDEWMRQHPELAEEFPLTVGLFAPDPDGTFDFNAYYRAIDEGARQSLTAEQQAALARRTAARMAYNHARSVAEDRGLKGNGLDVFLAQIRGALDAEYGPDWNALPLGVVPGRPAAERISELERAVADPVLAATDAGKGVAVYLEARETVLERLRAATGADNATLGRREAASYRAFLRQLAQAILREHPGFGAAWSRVLSNEVEE